MLFFHYIFIPAPMVSWTFHRKEGGVRVGCDIETNGQALQKRSSAAIHLIEFVKVELTRNTTSARYFSFSQTHTLNLHTQDANFRWTLNGCYRFKETKCSFYHFVAHTAHMCWCWPNFYSADTHFSICLSFHVHRVTQLSVDFFWIKYENRTTKNSLSLSACCWFVEHLVFIRNGNWFFIIFIWTLWARHSIVHVTLHGRAHTHNSCTCCRLNA